MKAVDTNILVYAHRRDNPFHINAAQLLENLSEENAFWTIPVQCLAEFYAIVTNAKIFKTPTPIVQAKSQIEELCSTANLSLISDLPGAPTTLLRLAYAGKITGGQIHDARIAAVCIDHGVELLYTADRDFSRFSGLKVKNPLV